MKIFIMMWALVGVLPGVAPMAQAQQQKAATGFTAPGGAAWKSPGKICDKLAVEIGKRLSGLDAQEVQAFVKDKENRRLLLIYYFACTETARQEEYRNFNDAMQRKVQEKKDEIARLENEVKNKKGAEQKNAKYRLKCAQQDLMKLQREAEYPLDMEKHGKVLQAVLADDEWMEAIAFSGEMHRFARVVQIMDAIAKADSGALKKGVARDITTAVALEYARNNCMTVDAVDRAKYFLKYWRQGRLNTTFDKLPMHQRRIACGWKPTHNSGTVKAFEWALNNVHVPDWQYPASCWRCGYILDNVYGDSIHGPHYYAPWAGVATDNHMWLTKNVGGVCGGLSHFGAASACANGVPALTAGEPGHCAYIVLVDGKWTPAYSLSWERGLHWIPWDNNWTYSALHLTDALYDRKNADKRRVADFFRILARMYQNTGDVQKALTCYEASAKAAPLNYPMWREYAAFLGDKLPQNQEAWGKLNKVLCQGMAGQFPEQCAELLKQCVYGRIGKSGMGEKELTAVCARFWKHAETLGPDRWYIENFANEQLKLCKNAADHSEETAINLILAILKGAASHDAYSGTMMAWCNKTAEGLSKEGQNKLADAMVQVLGADKNLSPAQKAKLLGGLLLSAEKARDITTFYSISKMIDPKEIHGTAAIPDFMAFPGKLVSEGGLPFASSTSEWDSPHTHSGLLTKQGGKIHTGKDNNAWIAVKLPKHAYITGVVFVGTNEWKLIHRFRPLRVQVSDTGRDDDWHDVGPVIENTGNYVITFDLQKERPKALYVRVLRPGGPEFFHANGIYIYGEPAA
ncbi:MAG: hypothetical protein E7031_06705 [Akkermansiaceae bacterium]|nr:hypothetical protein [Akkermansiaceae bacterium]